MFATLIPMILAGFVLVLFIKEVPLRAVLDEDTDADADADDPVQDALTGG